MLRWNVGQKLMFFRISSNIIPLGSHPAMQTDWQSVYREEIERIGDFVKASGLRISMHPGQFVVINSPSTAVYRSSVAELEYHAEVLDMMGLDSTHKLQIHLGGLHGDAAYATQMFIDRYGALPDMVKQRLVIENDERLASVQDCVRISEATGIPVLFDTLHHEVRNNGETMIRGLDVAMSTWKATDGTPMIDFSTQNPDKKTGAHAVTLDVVKFRSFIRSLKGRDIDIMLEIKNKEASALQARLVLDSLTGATDAPSADTTGS